MDIPGIYLYSIFCFVIVFLFLGISCYRYRLEIILLPLIMQQLQIWNSIQFLPYRVTEILSLIVFIFSIHVIQLTVFSLFIFTSSICFVFQ